jgi:hypothetical protein
LTDYPEAGSFALHIDAHLPAALQRPELVEILRYVEVETVVVSFPLRDEHDPHEKTVPLLELIDARELTFAEAREMHDLDRALIGAKHPDAAKEARRIALHKRNLWAPLLAVRVKTLLGSEQRKAIHAA